MRDRAIEDFHPLDTTEKYFKLCLPKGSSNFAERFLNVTRSVNP